MLSQATCSQDAFVRTPSSLKDQVFDQEEVSGRENFPPNPCVVLVQKKYLHRQSKTPHNILSLMVSSHCEGGTFSLAIDHTENEKHNLERKKTLQKRKYVQLIHSKNKIPDNGACAHYVMVSKCQWKPFWLATQRDPQNDWTATQNGVNYDVFAQAPLSYMDMYMACTVLHLEKNELMWLKHDCLRHSRWRHAKITSLQWLSSPDCLGHFAEKRSLHSSPVKARRNSRRLGRIANDNFVFLQRHAHTASSVGLTLLADPSVLGWRFQNCFPPKSSFLTGRHEVVSAWVCKTVEVPRTRIVGQVGGHGTMSKG